MNPYHALLNLWGHNYEADGVATMIPDTPRQAMWENAPAFAGGEGEVERRLHSQAIVNEDC